MRDYLVVGPEKLLGRMFNKCLGEKYGYLPGEDMKFDDSKTILVLSRQVTLKKLRLKQKEEERAREKEEV